MVLCNRRESTAASCVSGIPNDLARKRAARSLAATRRYIVIRWLPWIRGNDDPSDLLPPRRGMPLEFRGAGFLKADNLRVCPRHGLLERARYRRAAAAVYFLGGLQRNPPICSTRPNIVCRLIIVCLNIKYNVRNFVSIVANANDAFENLNIWKFEYRNMYI